MNRPPGANRAARLWVICSTTPILQARCEESVRLLCACHGDLAGAVTFNSMLQAEIPEHGRGRVFSSMSVLWQGRQAHLSRGRGALADLYGIEALYYLGGAALLAALAAGLAPNRRAPTA